jgi:hypothetical protein
VSRQISPRELAHLSGWGVSLSGNLLRGNAIESFDRVAQVAEQRTFNPQVVGSSPTPVIHNHKQSVR